VLRAWYIPYPDKKNERKFIIEDRQAADPLSEFPPDLWRVLINWFFDLQSNNIYHNLFYKIFEIVVIKTQNEVSLKYILTKYKFITKMIDNYSNISVKTDFKGHILLFCNILRLTGDTQSSDDEYLRRYLNSHSAWRAFLPVLREATFQQTRSLPVTKSLFDKPLPHVVPKSYVRSKLDLINDEDNIDLGSSYAKQLGFTDTPPDYALLPKIISYKNNPRGSSDISVDGSDLLSEIVEATMKDQDNSPKDTNTEGSSKKKKNKKKKRKSLTSAPDLDNIE